MDLSGKTCIVTGGAKGIGKAIARLLHEESACVAVWDNDRMAAEDCVKELLSSDRGIAGALAQEVDVSDERAVERALTQVTRDLGTPHGLVNNAGVYSTRNLHEEDGAEWDRVLAVNLKSAFICIKHVSPLMAAAGGGRIVNVSSISGRKESIFASASYCASKAGVIGLTRYAAATLAKHHINVNCIAPALTRTPLLEALGEAQIQRALSTIPLGFMGEPEDVAQVAVFLLKESSRFITGATIDVNGGSYMN